MSTVKKIVIGVFAVILVFGAVAGGAVYFKKSRQETVPVVQVESIASDYYTDDTMLEGNIVTNVTQNVNVDKDMIIQQVYVNEGDSVSKGDKLISFDMTLVQMELNIARLKKQQQEQDLETAGLLRRKQTTQFWILIQIPWIPETIQWTMIWGTMSLPLRIRR